MWGDQLAPQAALIRHALHSWPLTAGPAAGHDESLLLNVRADVPPHHKYAGDAVLLLCSTAGVKHRISVHVKSPWHIEGLDDVQHLV